MKTNFTKGKWYVKSEIDEEYPQKTNYSVHCDPFNDGKFTFTPIIADMRFARFNEEAEANAKLIATAPEMFEMLQNIKIALKSIHCDIIINDIDNLLRKATE